LDQLIETILVLVANVSDDARKVCDEVCGAAGFPIELLEFRIYFSLIGGNRRQTFLLWECHGISLGRYGINDPRDRVFHKETRQHPPFGVPSLWLRDPFQPGWIRPCIARHDATSRTPRYMNPIAWLLTFHLGRHDPAVEASEHMDQWANPEAW
jgi:hypothetical protein